jgi:hypothetical protein
MKFTYGGVRVPWFLPKPLYEGYQDGRTVALRHETSLYRFPFWKHLLWRIGNLAGKAFKPLR